ncbi:MAG: M28 family metallopeptidase [Promethearchaeota archaeon]
MSNNNLNVEKYTDYIMETIKLIIEKYGDRDPGSQGEYEAQKFLKSELEKYTDSVEIESFKVAPKAIMSFLPIVGSIMLASIIFYWFYPLIALILTSIAVLIVIMEFLLFKQFLDPFFPKRTSHNVISRKIPKGNIKRTIIMSGHADAAYEWRYNKINPKLLRVILIPSIIGLFLKLIVDFLNTIFNFIWNNGYNNIWGFLGLIQFFFIPFIIAVIFFSDFSVVVPGASDNLSGTVMTLAIAKYFHDEGIEFENTEINYLITGSEEAGLRGAKAFVKRHKEELRTKNTAFISLESFRDFEYLSICDKDMNGIIKHHPAVCQLLKKAAENCKYEIKYQTVYIGATDAAAFSKSGIPASSIEAMDPGPPRWYHTRYDNWKDMNRECIKAGFKIALETIRLYDKEGLSLH